MSTCKWLQETEKQAVKLTVSDTEQNPEHGKVFEAFLDKLPGDQLGFHYQYGEGETEYWSAWVIWEIEHDVYHGDLLIEVLSNGLSEDELPYHDEVTGKRFWQVSVEMDEVDNLQDEIEADRKMKADILSAEQLQKLIGEAPAPLTKFTDKLQKAGDDPERPPFTNERGEFDPGD